MGNITSLLSKLAKKQESSGKKVAVVGCGNWGRNLVRNFSELGALAAISDLDHQSAARLAAKYKVPVLDWQEVLSDTSIDGVVVATPANTHYRFAKEALHVGKNVYVEKPLTQDLQEAKELFRLATHNHLKLMVGHILQYHPAFTKLKKLVMNNRLGKIQHIYSNRLNFAEGRLEENVLWDYAPHDISMILSLVGMEPCQIVAICEKYNDAGIAASATMHLRFANGLKAHVFNSWLHPFKEQRLVVVGDVGMAVFNDGLSWDNKLQIHPYKKNWTAKLPHIIKEEGEKIHLEEAEPLKMECQHFLDCMESGREPITNGYEGMQVVKILQIAQEVMQKDEYMASDLLHTRQTLLQLV